MSDFRYADPFKNLAADKKKMGVYDHMMRPSMGHRMQVELRESMLRYHGDKTLLQQQFSQLCFNNKELHTSPLPPSPIPSVKRWGEPGSQFNKAPEVAAQKARQAKLEKENLALANQHKENELKVKNTLLPPLMDEGNTEEAQKPQSNDTNKKSSENKTAQKTQPKKKQSYLKGRKITKKTAPKKAEVKDKPLPLIKLPTIYSANPKRSMWDSGRNHIHPVGKSTTLEKNQTDEDCRNFSHTSVTIPANVDAKRTEIKLPPQPQQARSKVKFTSRQPLKLPAPAPAPANNLTVTENSNLTVTENSRAESQVEPPPTKDHFPKVDQRLPELDDASSVADSDDDTSKPAENQPLQLPLLPVVRLTESKLANRTLHPTTYHVPRLHLDNGPSPVATSAATGRSGATGATYMSQISQETQEWKGVYMSADNPYQKSRMLAEILHAVRQRMHDNEQDLRLMGEDSRLRERQSIAEGADIMLLHGQDVSSSGANTSRSQDVQQKPFKLPHHRKKRAAGGHQSQSSKLHSYLNKMSHKRRGIEPQRHSDRGPFHMANMTIREITQSSMEHCSTVHTAQTAT